MICSAESKLANDMRIPREIMLQLFFSIADALYLTGEAKLSGSA